MSKLSSWQVASRRGLFPIGLLCAILTVELASPAAAIDSQPKFDSSNSSANVTSDLPEENLVARCRYKTIRKRRRSVIIRRGPFRYRGRYYGRNYVLRRIYPARRVRVRVCS